MDKDNCLVQVEGEDGKVFNMLILKEFDYKNKKYAVLTEVDKCHCEEDCDCNGECDKECDCDDEACHCSEECDCGCKEGKECTCSDDDCHCGCHECNCEDEDVLCILEIAKDEDGNEIFKSIDDEKLFNEVVEEADKVLYED